MEVLIPILIFSTPIIWIVMHYKYRGKPTSGFTEEETRQLHELLADDRLTLQRDAEQVHGTA